MGIIGKIRGILFLIAMLVGGPVMLVAGYQEAKTTKAMADHGQTADAVVGNVSWSTKRGRERNFKAEVIFTTADNQPITKTISVSDTLGKQLRDAPEDQPSIVKVKYLPEAPNTVQMADHEDESSMEYGIGAVMLLIGIGMLVYRLRKKPDETEAAAQPA